MATRHDASEDDNFSQARVFYQVSFLSVSLSKLVSTSATVRVQRVLDDCARARLIDNIVGHLEQCTDKNIIRRSVAVLANVDDAFGKKLADRLHVDLANKVRFLSSYPLIFLHSTLEQATSAAPLVRSKY